MDAAGGGGAGRGWVDQSHWHKWIIFWSEKNVEEEEFFYLFLERKKSLWWSLIDGRNFHPLLFFFATQRTLFLSNEWKGWGGWWPAGRWRGRRGGGLSNPDSRQYIKFIGNSSNCFVQHFCHFIGNPTFRGFAAAAHPIDTIFFGRKKKIKVSIVPILDQFLWFELGIFLMSDAMS